MFKFIEKESAENINESDLVLFGEEVEDDDDDLSSEEKELLNDDELMSEVTMLLIEVEAEELIEASIQEFLQESGQELVRDKLLTEDAINQSFIALSPLARRQKAISLMKLKMAKEAGDPRYKRVVALRRLWKKLLDQIRSDSKYSKAELIVKKQQFRLVSNPAAKTASLKNKMFKLKD